MTIINNKSTGSIHLIIGPMFSGKTTTLINLYNQNITNNNKVAVINYYTDRRYHESMLSTHDLVAIECINAKNVSDIMDNEEVKIADTILINEGQFFHDIFETSLILAETFNKNVYICGLDGDFKRNKFGGLLDLIPYCDTITKLHSKCNNCGEKALFSHRITDDTTTQVVIGTINYIPLCRICYTKMTTPSEL
jgi:thymidine kinase